MSHALQPMRHTHHVLDHVAGTRKAMPSDASSGPSDASSDASEKASPQVMTLVTLVTLQIPFSSIAHARTHTGRHTELRVTSVTRHLMRHRRPL